MYRNRIRAGTAQHSLRVGGPAGAVRAVAGWRIGIDLEQRGAVAPAQARQFATPAERLASGGDATVLWCLKEAAWKAFGEDAAPPTPETVRRFELVFADSRVTAVRVGGSAPVAVQSSVRELRDGWIVATVAVRERDVARLRSVPRRVAPAEAALQWRRAHGR